MGVIKVGSFGVYVGEMAVSRDELFRLPTCRSAIGQLWNGDGVTRPGE